jgi:hypothetical protein
MSTAARQALASWASPVNQRRRASPPNLSSLPPLATAMSKRATKQFPIVAVSSSAPTLPCLARASESLVKPEMSTKAIVPFTWRKRSSGVRWIQSMVSLGK